MEDKTTSAPSRAPDRQPVVTGVGPLVRSRCREDPESGTLESYPDSRDAILWNIPEQKSGKVAVIGGHSGSFAGVVKTAEYFAKMPVKEVLTVLPESLRGKLPLVPDVVFAPATQTGSFAKSPELNAAVSDADISLLCGDFSKNSASCLALAEAVFSAEKPTVWMKDTVDLLAPEATRLLERGGVTVVATLAQLQKLLREMYYPKMLMLSMPMQPVKETLHKFTLSYPAVVVTLHQGQVLVAGGGEVYSLPLEKTGWTPLTLWTGDLSAKITALQMWNAAKPYDAAIAALEWQA